MDGVQGCDLRAAYTDPIQQLLIIGETSIGDPADWPDYTADLGIGPEHVSALIGLAIGMITIGLSVPSFITTLGMLFLINGAKWRTSTSTSGSSGTARR